jgi:plastocyanin
MKQANPSITRIWLLPILLAATSALAVDIDVKVFDLQGKAVADAVVQAHALAGNPAPPPAARPSRTATIEQIDREFVPYVMPVRTGTTVNFPNRDPLMHHVYSFSSVKNFEIKLYSGELPRGIVFDKAGIVTLGCNIHDWMLGYIFVADTPWFAKTGASGAARIADLSPGEYELRLWHPDQRATAPAKPIKVDARTNTEWLLTIDVGVRKKKFKPPLNPAQYR